MPFVEKKDSVTTLSAVVARTENKMIKHALALFVFPILIASCTTHQVAKNADGSVVRDPASDSPSVIKGTPVEPTKFTCPEGFIYTTDGWHRDGDQHCAKGGAYKSGQCILSIAKQSEQCPAWNYFSDRGWAPVPAGICAENENFYSVETGCTWIQANPAPADSCPPGYVRDLEKGCLPNLTALRLIK
jgi:hypothetical protein